MQKDLINLITILAAVILFVIFAFAGAVQADVKRCFSCDFDRYEQPTKAEPKGNEVGDSGAMSGLDFSINYTGWQIGVSAGHAEDQQGNTTNGVAGGIAKRFRPGDNTTGLGSFKMQLDERGGKKYVGTVIFGF